MVKQTEKIWSHNWQKNDDENGGALKVAINNCKPEQVVVHSQTKKNGRIWTSMNECELLEMIKTNKGVYEVITKFPHKLFFDIDGKVERQHTKEEFDNWIDNTLGIIINHFPNAEFAISGSNTETKMSLHIVCNNYLIRNEDERQKVKTLVKYIRDNEDLTFDFTVYSKNRNMKAINQSKDDGRVQEIIRDENPKNHLITCFINENCLEMPEFNQEVEKEILIEKSHKTFNIGLLPKLNLSVPKDLDINTLTPEQALQLLPNNNSCEFTYRHLVCRFCYYNDISFEMFFAWIVERFNGKYDKQSKLSQWTTHWKNMKDFPPVSMDRIITILAVFYPHLKKDIHYRRFAESFLLSAENICKIETINQTCFNDDKKYSLFNVGMGGGKTAQTITYLSSEPNFVWIAPNKALGTNTHKRFEDEQVDVTHYENIKTKDKKNGNMKTENKLIICLNSLHYLEDVKYEVVVIDEIETVLDKFLGDFLEQGSKQYKSLVWQTFIKMIRNANKVIFLDAFITTKTLNLIKEIEGTLNKVRIYERLIEPQTRTIKYMENDDHMLQDIITKIKNGNKLFIFYPYKNSSKNWNSMEQIFNTIEIATGKKGIFYNADVDDKKKKGLKDVNTNWSGKDFVIVNNIVTCGVNYEKLDFDYCYIFIAPHNSPRDIIQVSYRARHLSSGVIKFCYMGAMKQENSWLNDCKKMNCKIYDNLFQSILIEKKSPIKRTIQLFCRKANYKQKADDFVVNSILEKEINKILTTQNVGMEYKDIPDIDNSQAEIIEEKCFCQEATMIEKYALNKFYFKKNFTNEKDELLGEIWDEKFIFFFKRLTAVLQNDNHIFNKIAKLNNYKSLFPVEFKKIKLNDEIKAEIFEEFSFKYVSSNSTATKICKEIYNTFFKPNLITTKTDEAKNITYEVAENVYDYYEYAKDNLIINQESYLTYNKMNEKDSEDFCIEI